MRLLVLTPEFKTWGGGVATFYRDFLHRLSHMDHEVRVVEGSAFATAPEANRANVDGITWERLEASRLTRWIDRFSHLSSIPTFRRHLAAAWAMWEQALEGPEFDVIEAVDWGLLFVPPVVARTHPVVVQGHASCGQISAYDGKPGLEASDMLIRLIERSCMIAASQIQTSSHANAAFWQSETRKSVTVIRPAWRAPESRTSGEVNEEGLVVGRLQSWKAPDTVCEALQLLGPRAPEIRWVGREVSWARHDIDSSAYLSDHYRNVWQSRLVHEPQIPPSDIARRQATAAFNLVPSHWDVFNFTAAEAMASGRPTIVSSGTGASELVQHGVNGFVFNAGNPADLAAAIDTVRSLSKIQQKEIADNAFETVRRALDPKESATQRLEQFHKLYDMGLSAEPLSSWLIESCSPPKSPVGEDAFLNSLPVRMLATHVAGRVLRRRKP